MKPATLVTLTVPGRPSSWTQSAALSFRRSRVGANASHHPTQKSRITGDEDTP